MGRGKSFRNRMMRLAAAFSAIALAACSTQVVSEQPPGAETIAARHPISGLSVIPLTVTSGETSHRFRVEVAETKEEQARGLMFRTELGPDEGMIFPYDGTRAQGFWMKNTPIPLDIIFIGPDRRISNIAAMTTPYSLESVYSVGPVLGVLELRGGRAAELGIEAGDLVEW